MSERVTRRAFFASVARYAAATGLSVGTALLVLRRKSPQAEAPCVGGGACRGCPVLRDCRLPQGMSTRQGMREVNRGR